MTIDAFRQYIALLWKRYPTQWLGNQTRKTLHDRSLLQGYIWYCLGKFPADISSATGISDKAEARLKRFSRAVAIAFGIEISSSLLEIPLKSSFQMMANTFVYKFPNFSKDLLAKLIGEFFAPKFQAYLLPSLNGIALVILFLAAIITLKLIRDSNALVADRDALKQEVELTV